MARIDIEFFQSLPFRPMAEQTRNCCTLWRALLDQMVEDILNQPRTEVDRHAQHHATLWFDGQLMYDAVASGFEDVCDLADLPQSFVRRNIENFMETA